MIRLFLLVLGISINGWSQDDSGSGISSSRTSGRIQNFSGVVKAGVIQRLQNRSFPSIFQAWGGILNLPGEESLVSIARHDVCWCGAGDRDGLVFDTQTPGAGGHRGLSTSFTAKSIENALNRRRQLQQLNPNIVLIANLNYYAGAESWLPPEHEHWLRKAKGERIVSQQALRTWYRFDFAKPGFASMMAKRAASCVNCGVYDGVLLDWWDESIRRELPARMELLKAIRRAIPDALIIINSNDRKSVNAAPSVNGVFMETGAKRATTPARWQQIQEAIEWNRANLLAPKLICLELWYEKNFDELNKMRAVTTMALTLTDGCCLFAEPNDAPGLDHKHHWYAFWNKTLGALPKDAATTTRQSNGMHMRQYENGYAVYNPMGNGPQKIIFTQNHKSVATGQIKTVHALPDEDGDIFLVAPTQEIPRFPAKTFPE